MKIPNLIGDFLEKNGFLSKIAGKDFDRAIEALSKASEADRGVFVVGEPGCGKSQFLHAIHLGFATPSSRYVSTIAEHRLDWLDNSSSFYFDDDIFLDEVGSEEIRRDYGEIVDVVGTFIQRYYDGKKKFCHLWGASNLGVTKPLNEGGRTLANFYGARVLDRILDLCVVVKFEGSSHRQKIYV